MKSRQINQSRHMNESRQINKSRVITQSGQVCHAPNNPGGGTLGNSRLGVRLVLKIGCLIYTFTTC